jgi:NADH-quinone oxidoreductase subunit N
LNHTAINLDAVLQSVIVSLPEIFLLATACLLLLIDLLLKGRRVALIANLAIMIVVTTAALSYLLTFSDLFGNPTEFQGIAYNGMFVSDKFSLFFKMIFYIATILTIMLSHNYLKISTEAHSEYFVMMLFALCGMMIMASGTDLISIYVGLELLALSMYVLTGFLKHDPRSNESALKFLILSALSTCLMLYGASLFYGLTGTTQLNDLRIALTGLAKADAVPLPILTAIDPAIVLATLFLLAGFAFKIAAVPFHMWVPDVYEGAPTPITAYMSVGSKAAGFAVILRVFVEALSPLTDIWLLLFAVIAVATMAVGSFVALVQTNIKRLLAYSSIAHAGFAMLGLVAGGESGVAIVMLYLLIYTLMNLGIFGVVVAMKSEQISGEQITDYSGLSKQYPILALVALIFLFSLAGIPPTAGFVAKFAIFVALIDQGYVMLAIIAVLFSVIAAFFYLRIVMLMYMRETIRSNQIAQSLGLQLTLVTTGIATLAIGLFPAWFFDLALSSVL